MLQNSAITPLKTTNASLKKHCASNTDGFSCYLEQQTLIEPQTGCPNSKYTVSTCRVSFGVVFKHIPAGMGSCPLQEFLGNYFPRRYCSFNYNLLATKYLSRRNWEWPCPIRHLGSANYSKITGLWHPRHASSQGFAKK